MILIALGANLPTARFGTPAEGFDAALAALGEHGIRSAARSRWHRSAPVPPAAGPWFVNGVIRAETALAPVPLMACLLRIEAAFGRRRSGAGADRPLDLDLLDYHGRVLDRAADDGGPALVLPHPRLAERAFVLVPLLEVAPDWRHPVSGAGAAGLLRALAGAQAVEPLSPPPERRE